MYITSPCVTPMHSTAVGRRCLDALHPIDPGPALFPLSSRPLPPSRPLHARTLLCEATNDDANGRTGVALQCPLLQLPKPFQTSVRGRGAASHGMRQAARGARMLWRPAATKYVLNSMWLIPAFSGTLPIALPAYASSSFPSDRPFPWRDSVQAVQDLRRG